MKNATGRFAISCLGASILAAALALPARAQKFSEWSAPVNLGPVVNSSGDDTCDSISRDGLTLYFAKGPGELTMWFTERPSLDAPWAAPQKLPATVNTPGSNNFCETLSADLHALYFISDRAGGCGGTDMWVSFRRDTHDNFGWEAPVNLGCQVNSPKAEYRVSPFQGEDGTEYIYFSSLRSGGTGPEGTSDIYVSRKQADGTFGPPTVVAGLNSAANEQRPNVRERDGLEIFFDSNRAPGLGGPDLWTSTRASLSDPWSAPVNLGPVVNSSATDARPSLSWDGTALYFHSNRPGGSGGVDLWVTTRTKLTGYVFPAAANVAGMHGAFYRTSMNLLNLNSQEITISAGLMTPSGASASKSIVLPANSYRTYDNFLEEVFGYTGGAGISLFDASSTPFVAVAEVYTAGAAGRLSIPLAGLNGGDAVAVAASGATSVVSGLRVNAATRANFGCSNLDPVPATVRVDFSAITDGAPAAAATDLPLGPSGWRQEAVPIPGDDIFAFFTVTSGGGPLGVYCYGVNVDNVSNDGTLVSAVRMP